MREIGFSRRKVKQNKVVNRRSASQDLDIDDVPARQLAEVDDDTKQPYASLPHDTHEESEEASALLPAHQWPEGGEDCQLPIRAKHVGSHRLDPFVIYPVEMSPRARLLLDKRKS
jgi:hypothetical protein